MRLRLKWIIAFDTVVNYCKFFIGFQSFSQPIFMLVFAPLGLNAIWCGGSLTQNWHIIIIIWCMFVLPIASVMIYDASAAAHTKFWRVYYFVSRRQKPRNGLKCASRRLFHHLVVMNQLWTWTKNRFFSRIALKTGGGTEPERKWQTFSLDFLSLYVFTKWFSLARRAA